MATYKRVSWQQAGKQVDVDVSTGDGWYTLSINGKMIGTQGVIIPPAAKDRAMYASRGAVGNIGPVVIYKDRAEELELLQAEAKAAPKPRNLTSEYLALEANVLAAERVVQQHDENPAYGYQQLEQAKAALQSWIEASDAHRAAYEAEVAARREEEATRRGKPLGDDIWNV